MFFSYGLFFYTIVVVGANVSPASHDAAVITFAASMLQQMLVNQVIKVLIHMSLVICLSKRGCGKARPCLLSILDQNILNAFQ